MTKRTTSGHPITSGNDIKLMTFPSETRDTPCVRAERTMLFCAVENNPLRVLFMIPVNQFLREECVPSGVIPL